MLIFCFVFTRLFKTKLAHNFTAISTRLKTIAFRFLLKILQILRYLGKSLDFFLTFAFVKPIKIIGLFIFRNLLTPTYRVYLIIKKSLITIFAPAKNKIIYPLLNKSTIHLIIILFAVAVIANNLFIKETQAQEFNQKTILTAMTSSQEDVTIVEKATTPTKKTAQSLSTGAIAVRPTDAQDISNNIGSDSILTSENSAAVSKPDSSGNGSTQNSRQSIEYYIVQGGDTISAIAEKFGVSTNTILWENKLGPRDYIKPGDKLTILPQTGLSYTIKKGDTLDKVAKTYGVDAEAIVEYNKLADATDIKTEQTLIIPGGQMPEAPATIRSTVQSKTAVFSILSAPPPSRVTSSARLLWPTPSHKINQYYRGGRHTGVDIDGTYSSPLYAADDGRVEFAASDRSGYGLHIIINHGGGVKTLYGHASKIFVKVGDSVKRGQTIAMMGCTGRCTGTHIHFEVRINGGFINPLSYL